MFTTVHSGWTVAVLCGDETIIAGRTLRADAERMAVMRKLN